MDGGLAVQSACNMAPGLVIYLDCNNRRLFSGECHEGTSLALTVGVPQYRALLDGPVLVEHFPHVVLAQLLVQHAHEQFPL